MFTLLVNTTLLIFTKGIIAYTEYLFLLTILIKPSSGFKIAFSMLDQDGSDTIDKEEFKVLESIFSSAAKDRSEGENLQVSDHGLQNTSQVSKLNRPKIRQLKAIYYDIEL